MTPSDRNREPEHEPRAGRGSPSALAFGSALVTLTLTATVRSWLRAANWTLSASTAAGRRLAAAVRHGESPAELLEEVRDEALAEARRMLGVTDIEERLGHDATERDKHDDGDAELRSLRERGAELLERSAELAPDGEEPHPAFPLILEQLAADEARILRLLASGGPQPIVDVYERSPLGQEQREAASRVSLVGENAGCWHPDRAAAYLDNLMRLGLVRTTIDPGVDEQAYRVLEAQPEVEGATGDGPGKSLRTRVERRALVLTDLGRAFCEMCLPVEEWAPQAERPAGG